MTQDTVLKHGMDTATGRHYIVRTAEVTSTRPSTVLKHGTDKGTEERTHMATLLIEI